MKSNKAAFLLSLFRFRHSRSPDGTSGAQIRYQWLFTSLPHSMNERGFVEKSAHPDEQVEQTCPRRPVRRLCKFEHGLQHAKIARLIEQKKRKFFSTIPNCSEKRPASVTRRMSAYLSLRNHFVRFSFGDIHQISANIGQSVLVS